MKTKTKATKPAAKFTIRPLAWTHELTAIFEEWSAPTPAGDYAVSRSRIGWDDPTAEWGAWEWVLLANDPGDNTNPVPCGTPEAGKRLAEAHWQKSVSASLIPA